MVHLFDEQFQEHGAERSEYTARADVAGVCRGVVVELCSTVFLDRMYLFCFVFHIYVVLE